MVVEFRSDLMTSYNGTINIAVICEQLNDEGRLVVSHLPRMANSITHALPRKALLREYMVYIKDECMPFFIFQDVRSDLWVLSEMKCLKVVLKF
ncbi:hypothetical protein Sjap_011244 [Stephania japonica]|uniref:Uncharacterized protein n=1 Tax=Stephania japonica TaxID=461633 RepID=A0AAP0JD56_9MAGN